MIYNHKRIPVWEWHGDESLCPECQSPLIAKRGDIICWHWAHHSNPNGRTSCPHEESAWHLAMKSAYLGFPGWDIEVPIVIEGMKFIVDAMNQSTGNIREFVHSLSPHYINKHRWLNVSGYNIAWIMDGEQFVSKRWNYCSSKEGRKYLLKPIALEMHKVVPMLVHWEDALWRCWKENVWFKCTGQASQEVLKRFNERKTLWENQRQSK